MQRKWRYKVERIKTPTFANVADKAKATQETLDRLGMEGWELVTVEAVSGGGYPLFYLKRPF